MEKKAETEKITEETIVETSYGKMQGVEGENAFVFKGVPYAKPPVGDLRWREPQKPDAWTGVYQADTFGAKCPQPGSKEGDFYYKKFYAKPEFMPGSSEDCLYLNIWTPKQALQQEDKTTYPVAIWIHGGGFMNGFGSELEFDGEAYAARGIVLVTINYRLGLFGYFAHPDLTKRDGHSGNYGLLDQIAAVDWVRENIHAFGGNAEKITIFGQSAGGMSVRALVSSPLMKGKIQGAIIQSAGGYHSPLPIGIDGKKLEKAAEKFLRKQKLTIEDAYKLSEEELLKLTMKFFPVAMLYTHVLLSLVPVVDGYALERNPDELLEQGQELPIRYMIGCTRNDIQVKKAGVLNPQKNKLYTSNLKWCEYTDAQKNPSYAYYFKRQLPGDEEGAFHSSELWYMFGTLKRCWRPLTPQDEQLSQRMLDSWAAFIREGNPGWPACDNDHAYHVEEFDVE